MKLKLLMWLFILTSATTGFAQSDSTLSKPAGAPVVLYQDTLFYLNNSEGSFSKEERAAAISSRILKLAEDRFFISDSVKVQEGALFAHVMYGGKSILIINEADAKQAEKSKTELANLYAFKIKESVLKSLEEHSLRAILLEVGLALLVLVVFFLLIKYVNKLFRFLFLKIQRQQNQRIKGVKVKNYELLTPDRQVAMVLTVAKFMRVLVLFMMVYFLLPVLFSIFPWTEGYADTLLAYIISPLRKIGLGLISYVPNMLTILVIVVVTRYAIKLLHYLAEEVETGKLEIPGFYADWAKPTYNIARFLLYAFMFIVIFPYLPGSNSPVFQGVSVFIGILFSLGSSSAIANMVAGMVLTYMRSFKIGDRIRINDITGDVVEKTLLVTRIRTTKNEDITIPNAMILNNHTTNYTTCSTDAQKGLVLYTTVTIGYDVPWPKVHQALIDAALATPLVLKEPKPFVLQTSLDDFYVSYQLNAYTLEAGKMTMIYSNIHQNIQDKFNEAGIEILSPHYRAQRDGNAVTIPANYLPTDYEAPSFRVEQVVQPQPPITVYEN
ncbi:mechanosensitive ion channel family protein [Pontibacter harenae]|uniref:mechanosensitive ion channel family protein n=1 Tax=Pontibacter harenae TaxID=2894083 RepID=UPI001E37629B|nr:mechanosensitive ion channel family protein [Pontibacter harenae]MCC9165365.1 mechanosensitive ion channel family protein [Pontibacter harenae]